MRFRSMTFLAAAAVVLSASSALGADPIPPGSGVPGPVAGAGLAYLAIAGGYYLVRRWRKHD